MINFEDLYDSYAQDVYRFSLFLSRDIDEAKDITSETFIRVWVRKNTIRTETLKAYLIMIARNIFLEKQFCSPLKIIIRSGYKMFLFQVVREEKVVSLMIVW